jgi:peptidoglycan hydrolase CwlO-like protein
MKVIMFVIIIAVLVISYLGGDWLVNYLSKNKKGDIIEPPKDLDDLEKEVEEKTDRYQEVVEKVNETEKKVKEIRKKTEVKK